LQPLAAQDAEADTEQDAEDAPIENAAVVDRTEAQPDAEAGENPKSEGQQGDVAALEQNTDAKPREEVPPERQPVPPSPVVTPSAQGTQAAPKADAASERPDKPVQHGETAQQRNAAAAGDAIAGPPPVEAAATGQGTVAALAAPAPSPPAALHDAGLAGLIGQMIVTGFDGTKPDEVGVKRVIALLENGKAGGAVITPRNVRSPKQLRALIEALRKAKVDVAPFLMVTHEGGDGQSLSAANGFSMYPSAAELGQSNDPLNAFTVYFHMAEELGSYGFNVNLGPVVDLGPTADAADGEAVSQSYGSTPKHVAAFGKAFRLAHRQKNILTVLKYFPRQAGPAAAALKDRGGVDALLETYRQLVQCDNADMVMSSHIVDPAFSDTADRPASLSAKAIKKRLREDVGFKGVVISADIGDAAVAARFPLKERVLGAIGAGSDMLLIGDKGPPENGAVEAIVAIVRDALASGRLSRNQLEASHGRIMSLKRSLGASANSIASANGKGAREPAAAQ
jgi:beta-N-acetylhexosaminidase